jgi:DNA replicative helicase MCM subunit Mcm2 (Cdc46/Mcm family)
MNIRYENYFIYIEQMYCGLYGKEAKELTRRMALSFIRICMVLTRLRYSDTTHTKEGTNIECLESDFMVACDMMRVLISHTCILWEQITEKTKGDHLKTNEKNTNAKFLEKLMELSTDNEYVFGKKEREEARLFIGIAKSSADRIITKLKKKELITALEGEGNYYKILTPA